MLKDLKDLAQSFQNALADRVNNPFVGSFVIAWIISNWRLVAIICFGSNSLESRLASIDQQELVASSNPYLHLYPVVAALTYTVVAPWFFWLIDRTRNCSDFVRRKTNSEHEAKVIREVKLKLANVREELLNEQNRIDQRERKLDDAEVQIVQREREIAGREKEVESKLERIEKYSRSELVIAAPVIRAGLNHVANIAKSTLENFLVDDSEHASPARQKRTSDSASEHCRLALDGSRRELQRLREKFGNNDSITALLDRCEVILEDYDDVFDRARAVGSSPESAGHDARLIIRELGKNIQAIASKIRQQLTHFIKTVDGKGPTGSEPESQE